MQCGTPANLLSLHASQCSSHACVLPPLSPCLQAAMVRAERSARELDGATFVPEITRLAAALWSGGDLDAQPAWARLSAPKRARALERIREMRSAREEQEVRHGGLGYLWGLF